MSKSRRRLKRKGIPAGERIEYTTPTLPMIERTTPIGPEPTTAIRGTGGTVTVGGRTAEVQSLSARLGPSPLREAYSHWNLRRWPRGQEMPLADIMELRRRIRALGVAPALLDGDRTAADVIDVEAGDSKALALRGPAADPAPEITPGWLPIPLDDAVALVIQAGYTPQPAVVRGRDCYVNLVGTKLLLMPFGKGTLAGPWDWVVAASEQLDEDHYARWGEGEQP